ISTRRLAGRRLRCSFGLNGVRALCLTMIFSLCPPDVSWAQTQSESKGSSDGLTGVWGAEILLGPFVRGELVLDGRISEWHARIGGFDVVARHEKNGVNFTLPGGRGEFRGSFANQGKRITGHWIQSASMFPYNSRYASPVELSEISPKVWRGDVKPLDHR